MPSTPALSKPSRMRSSSSSLISRVSTCPSGPAAVARHIAEYPVKVIVMADKAANAESLLKEWRHVGDDMWQKFNQHDKKKHAWYYYSCADALKEFSDSEVMKKYLEHLKELFG